MNITIWKDYKESYRHLLKLGLPVMATQLGIIIVNFADTIMVGRHSTNELAASAFVSSVFVVVTVMQIGFAAGITPLVGALFGRGEHREAGRTLRGALHVNVAVSAVFTCIMGILYFFLDKFGQDPELVPIIRNYYLIILFTLLPMSIFNSFQQMCNGVRDTATPMWFILSTNALNVLGNWVLIFGKFGCPELGLAGAGISTLCARLISTIGLAIVFFKAGRYRIYKEGYKAAGKLGDVHRQVWVTSYPIMIQNGVECVLWAFGTIVCGWYGKVQLAAYQVVNTIAQLGFMTYLSFGTATSILVANHTGVKDLRRVRRVTMAGLHLNFVLSTIASLIFIFLGEWLIRIFTPDQLVVSSALALILPLVVYQYMDAAQLTYVNAIRGTAKVQPLLWISLITYVIIGIPTLLLLAQFRDSGNVGIFWSFCIVLAVAAVMAAYFFYAIMRHLNKDYQLAS